jgi:hypothetical protein
MVTGTPSAGDHAFLTDEGKVKNSQSSGGGFVASPSVGRFLSSKDEDGYVKLSVDLPQLPNDINSP